ncbi:hypothetical protein IFM89_018731 [Coptis chinensis]|uniref:Pentatricopeptide repeat-containing protein n=1 Tax=Coptis chinensis TaxID=261450 RepID=A0A835M5C5_9MAGN|nr:hypothetical protein IFM89_018731 [Coptis chinensis]
MKRNHIEHDLMTFGSLVSGVCSNISRAGRRYHVVDRRSKKAGEMIFQLLNLLILMPEEHKRRISCKFTEEFIYIAEKLMKDITRNGVVFDLHFYNAVINGYCRAHMLRDAYLYVELMQNDGLNAKHMTYRAHTTWSNWSSYTAINNMSETGCLPDKITQHSYRRSMQEWESS